MTERRRIYLDHNAGAPLSPEAGVAVNAAMARIGGNPSSIHAEGRAARDLVETGRRQLAELVGGNAEELILTGSGTEAVALGMIGLARAAAAAGSPRRVLVLASEHPAGRGAGAALAAEGFSVRWLSVNRWGQIDLDAARASIAGGAALISASLANHEVGTVQPIAELAALAADVGAAVFCDAVQAAGKRALVPADLGVAGLAISAHKFGGPAGVGALWLSPNRPIDAVVAGGHQERDRRPGTENALGITAAGAAAAGALTRLEATETANRSLIERLESGLASLGCEVIGGEVPRIGNTSCFRHPGAPAETVVQALDLAGFAISAGAACTSGRLEPSPVLLAMGMDGPETSEAIRVSVGASNQLADIEALLEALETLLPRVRRHS